MELGKLLINAGISTDENGSNIDISNIQYDSRKIAEGDLFVAIKGEKSDGHDFIEKAISQGARAIVGEAFSKDINVLFIQADNSRKALSQLSAAYFGFPARSMRLIGVTGTNGKTSVAYLLEHVLNNAGIKTGMLGTIAYRFAGEEFNAPWTTPESLELHGILEKMRNAGTEVVVMETSSHALIQCRLHGLIFDTAIFTNLSQDHLDYHETMEQYAEAKRILFEQVDSGNGINIVNSDDPVSDSMCEANDLPTVRFGLKDGNIFSRNVQYRSSGITAKLVTPGGIINLDSRFIGQHNLYNIMAAAGAALALDIEVEMVEEALNSAPQAPGRLETVDAPFPVFVDYAHTPDAIEKVTASVKPLVKGKLIVLYGCGGDRDRAKRPLMGQAAEKGSDVAILTSDNPRTEDPEQIISDVLKGLTGLRQPEVILDRTEAIERALDIACEDDWVLLLGKGHETYQILGTNRIDYDDREIAKNFLKRKFV